MRRIFLVLFFLTAASVSAEFLIGVGKADVTGPAAQAVAAGYSRATQTLNGVYTRLWARAFLIGHPTDVEQRVLYVSLEACTVSEAVLAAVLKELKVTYGALYHRGNAAISATHTHTGPGGYMEYFLYSLATAGFVQDSFDAQVKGIVEAVKMAHERAELGTLAISRGELLDASINRSPTAYLHNPESERQKFRHDTDKTVIQLEFTAAVPERGRCLGPPRRLGLINWFAVHGTSLNNSVTLISGDNKGVAAQMSEKYMEEEGTTEEVLLNNSRPGFVAAFAQSISGDVSPNTLGAFCIDSSQPCHIASSSCQGRSEMCHGRGPGWPDAFDSCRHIAEKQFLKSRQLLEQDSPQLEGDIDMRTMFVNMSSISLEGTPERKTCRPAMGYSFAAGTSDGPGMFDFVQGTVSHSFFWDRVGGILHKPSASQRRCHSPKPILIDTGALSTPLPWQPEILQLQIFRIGRLVVICVPAEPTTMAGRRLRAAVFSVVHRPWGEDVEVVISTLTNGYASYVTTFEEYQVQRYEAASTIYGPHTLDAFIQEFVRLAEDMVEGVERTSAVSPPEYTDRRWSSVLPVIFDTLPPMVQFGDVASDRERRSYRPGETVIVEFWSANPRNSLGVSGHTFMTVERFDVTAEAWTPVATEDDFSTRFAWSPRLGIRLMPCSTARLSWTIQDTTPDGTYRIRHFGHAKTHVLRSDVTPFEGQSSLFTVQRFATV